MHTFTVHLMGPRLGISRRLRELRAAVRANPDDDTVALIGPPRRGDDEAELLHLDWRDQLDEMGPEVSSAALARHARSADQVRAVAELRVIDDLLRWRDRQRD